MRISIPDFSSITRVLSLSVSPPGDTVAGVDGTASGSSESLHCVTYLKSKSRAGGVGKWGGLVSGCVTVPSQPSALGEDSEGLELESC